MDRLFTKAAHASAASAIVPSELLSDGGCAATRIARPSARVSNDKRDRDRDRVRHLARNDAGGSTVGPRRQPGGIYAERADSRKLVRRDGRLARQRDEPR